MSLDKFVIRAAELTGAYGNYGARPELIDAKTIAAARCTMVNHEIQLFIHFCYQRSEQGRFINLRANSQIPRGVWCPWGSSGKASLTRTERDVVRCYLRSLNVRRGAGPLFFYNAQARRWHVDTIRYPTVEDAGAWLTKYQMTPALWLDFSLWND